jgi:hypothetical protein
MLDAVNHEPEPLFEPEPEPLPLPDPEIVEQIDEALSGPAFEEPEPVFAPEPLDAEPALPLVEDEPEPVEDPKQQQELALVDRRQSLIEQAAALQVADQATYDRAAEIATTLQGWIKEAEAHFDPDIEAAHKLHKSLCDKRTAFVKPLKEALDAMKVRAGNWFRTEQARIAEENRKAQEAERARVEAERKKALDEAKAAAAKGDVAAAAAKVAESKTIEERPVQTATPAPTAARGMSHRAQWTAEVTDLKVLVKAIAKPHVLREVAAEIEAKGADKDVVAYLKALADSCVDIPFAAVEESGPYLRTRAKADGATLRWPGVKFWDKGNTSVRA